MCSTPVTGYCCCATTRIHRPGGTGPRPAGGLNHGESYAAAAARELAEETGWDNIALLGEVHRQMRLVIHEGRAVRQHERLFLARTGQVRRELGDVAAMHAGDGIAAWRWWTLAELDATAELVWPRGLAALIRSTLTAENRRPATDAER